MQLPAGDAAARPPWMLPPTLPYTGRGLRGGKVTITHTRILGAVAEAAAAETAATEPTAIDLAQYGAIGTLCALFVWFAFRAWKREIERCDRLEAEHRTERERLEAEHRAERDRLEGETRRLHVDIQEKAIPALLASATALTEVTELLREQQRRNRYYDEARPPRRDGEV